MGAWVYGCIDGVMYPRLGLYRVGVSRWGLDWDGGKVKVRVVLRVGVRVRGRVCVNIR